MSGLFLTLAGIAVSVGLFFLGYRQTVGARHERVISANTDVERILVRRVVLESYSPTLQDVRRLIRGKANDFRVRVIDLETEEEILNRVFTRIVESDLIAPEQRDQLLGRVLPSLQEAEGAPIDEATVEQLPSGFAASIYRRSSVAAMALIASMIGATGTGLIGLQDLDTKGFAGFINQYGLAFAATLLGSLGIISAGFYVYRLRDSTDTVHNQLTALDRAIRFEREVAEVIAGLGIEAVTGSGRDKRVDFVLDRGEKKLLIEVKAWNRPMPRHALKRAIEHLANAVSKHEAAEGILVTPSHANVPPGVAESSGVRILTLKGLRNYLRHGD